MGQDIPASGSSFDYICFPYCIPVVELMNAWERKNYGVMGSHLRSLFPSSTSDKKCAGLCRKNFERRALEQYAITHVEELAYGLSKVTVDAYISGCAEPITMVFGCCLETPPEGLSPTSRENGRWYLIPWDIGIPYLNFD